MLYSSNKLQNLYKKIKINNLDVVKNLSIKDKTILAISHSFNKFFAEYSIPFIDYSIKVIIESCNTISLILFIILFKLPVIGDLIKLFLNEKENNKINTNNTNNSNKNNKNKSIVNANLKISTSDIIKALLTFIVVILFNIEYFYYQNSNSDEYITSRLYDNDLCLINNITLNKFYIDNANINNQEIYSLDSSNSSFIEATIYWIRNIVFISDKFKLLIYGYLFVSLGLFFDTFKILKVLILNKKFNNNKNNSKLNKDKIINNKDLLSLEYHYSFNIGLFIFSFFGLIYYAFFTEFLYFILANIYNFKLIAYILICSPCGFISNLYYVILLREEGPITYFIINAFNKSLLILLSMYLYNKNFSIFKGIGLLIAFILILYEVYNKNTKDKKE